MRRDPVYLDYQAATPLDSRVLAAMLPALRREFANPSSSHVAGRRAAAVLRDARVRVQDLIGAAHETEVVFTSGATEANHLAVNGVASSAGRRAGHIVTTAVEHKSVLAACDRLVAAGWEVTRLGVDRHGRVELDRLADAITSRTVLVSVMYANNEIGTVQPIEDIHEITRAAGVLLHVDAAQAAGTLGIDVARLGADLVSISSHKTYGPKGVGALYVRKGTAISAQFPGSQEFGLRAGTGNVAGATGLAEALRIADLEREREVARISRMCARLGESLITGLRDAWLNGHPRHRLPGSLSVTIPGVDAMDLVQRMPQLCVSTGSACADGNGEPSHVLTAIGLDRRAARATLRIGLGRFTTVDEVDMAAELIVAAVQRWRDRVG